MTKHPARPPRAELDVPAAVTRWLAATTLRALPVSADSADPADPADPDEARALRWLAAGADPADASWPAAEDVDERVEVAPIGAPPRAVLLARRSSRRPRPPDHAERLAAVAELLAAQLDVPVAGAEPNDREPVMRRELADTLGPTGAAVVVAIDRLTVVNEVFGRPAGNTVLEAVHRRLTEWAGAAERVRRMSGARFGIVRPDLSDPLAATAAAGELRELLADPVVTGGLGISRSVSIGVSADSAADAPERVKRAVWACLVARTYGGDAVVRYEDAAMEQRLAKLQLELELDHALRSGQLRLFYQPEFDLRTGELLAVEALLRWQHPRLGLVRADAFVEASERSRTFGEVQRWVVDEACRQLGAWQALPAGRRIGLRINISAWQVARSSILDDLTAAIERHGLRPENLCVELTERRSPRQVERVAGPLQAIVDRGVSIAIDDFGTGEGTVSQLITLPVDTIKIDQSFVLAMRSDPRADAVVAGLIGLAESLELETVAEGVDGADTAARLVQLGCRRGQGNALGEAAPAGEVEPLLRR